MNNEFDDFTNAIDNISIERKTRKFKINQLKIEHYHWNSGEINVGMPISTSIELTCKYNFETEQLNWMKIISYTYINNYRKKITDIYTEQLENTEQLINEIEKKDLRNLKNNYFSAENPEDFTHWELTYNNYFKIVGTYDQEIEEFATISDKLNFKKVIEKATKRMQDNFNDLENKWGNIWN